MPIYLCQPGTSTNEPWRHGVQVYERPFPMSNDDDHQNNNSNNNAPSSTNTAAGIQTTPPNTTTPSTNTTHTNNTTNTGPEQIVVMIKLPPSQLIHAPSQTFAQSIANIDNEKIIALKRYLTEFISSPTDRVLIFCNNSGNNSDWDDKDCKADVIAARLKLMNYEEHQTRMPLGGLGVVSERDILPNCVSASTIGVDKFLNTEGGNSMYSGGLDVVMDKDDTLSTLVVDNGAEAYLKERIATCPTPPNITMVINYDMPSTIETYTSRLQYTTKSVVTFFTTENISQTNDLVNVLKTHGQKVPKELNQGNNERGRRLNAVPVRDDSHSPAPEGNNNTNRQHQFLNARGNMAASNSSDDEPTTTPPSQQQSQKQQQQEAQNAILSSSTRYNIRPNPVRRVRHAEVVLVDQCIVAYGRSWLRLRWPGSQGGFGGFVALSKVEDMIKLSGMDVDITKFKSEESEVGEVVVPEAGGDRVDTSSSSGVQPTSTNTTTVAATSTTETALLCQETNTHYPTSDVMKLMAVYDDGLNGTTPGVVEEEDGNPMGMEDSMGSLENGDPIFCRICREGIHDVNYDLETVTQQQPAAPTAPSGDNAATASQRDQVLAAAEQRLSSNAPSGESSAADQCRIIPASDAAPVDHLANLPPIVLHHPTAENPLLAPCDCTGTMAFVHYLCIEQWRCRSRHPGARGGLNCETCGAEYTLPPPPNRPANRNDLNGGVGVGPNGLMGEEDWLDAMPPHVLAALRRPHPAWQLGAAVVRRRWLRPVVPILVSPLVALYCRARRTLKKRGVSRRRWACSLCRRRARWKCVRCLRSYYCSRQCQNVSWHIVHKHVCYKPVRFWWSVVVYAIGIIMAVPRLLENFPIYDAMVTLLPVNFIALGITFGGIASALKRSTGVDIRGRMLEIIVVLLTSALTLVTSGLVRGYFGDSSQCLGVLTPLVKQATEEKLSKILDSDFDDLEEVLRFKESVLERGEGFIVDQGPFYPALLNKVLLDIPFKQLQLWYQKWDFIVSKLGFVSHRFVCVPTADGNTDYSTIGCSPPTRTINPQFYKDVKCSADLSLVLGVWFAALGVLLIGSMYRQLRGARRNVAAAARGRNRPHQD